MICLFFMIDSSVLVNVFCSVNLKIGHFTNILIYKFHLFLSKAIAAIHHLLFHTFFWSSLTHVSDLKLLKSLLRLPFSKWLKSCLFILTQRRGANRILSQTFVILDEMSVIFGTFYACAIEKTFEIRVLILWGLTALTHNKPPYSVVMQFELYHFEGFSQTTWMIPQLPNV